MKIAAVQTNSSASVQENLQNAEAAFHEAVAQGARFVAFPENFLLMAENRTQQREVAEALDGPSVTALRAWARREKAWLLAGSVQLRAARGPRLTNTSLLISPTGKIAGRYDKIHLFDARISSDRVYEESKNIQPGKKTVLVKTPFGKVGLSVCYDLRFPELYRGYAREGAQLLTIPAAFTVPTGEAHWDVLTRARAIENLCFVIAPAQSGEHAAKRRTYGHTRIIDPWGQVLAERAEGAGIVYAELDFEALAKRRAELPALRHRRLRA
ncbi:MAG: carbon-nitrogen hydrolase family protein [Bacteriovoracia bacterium]